MGQDSPSASGRNSEFSRATAVPGGMRRFASSPILSPGAHPLFSRIVASTIAMPLVLVLVGCATRPAPAIRGHWKPVNHFPDAPQSIPLERAYVFYPSPMDRTLKTMLDRWAADSKRTLDYRLSSDFTLYRGISDIRTPSLAEALARLNAAYAAQGVIVVSDGLRIVVSARDEATQGVDATEE